MFLQNDVSPGTSTVISESGLVGSEGRRSLLTKPEDTGNPYEAIPCPDGESCVCYDPTWYCDTLLAPPKFETTLPGQPGGIVTDATPQQARCEGGFYRKQCGDCSLVLRKKQCVKTPKEKDAKDRGITAGRILHGSPAVTLASKDCLDEEYISVKCGTTGGGNDPIITGFDMRKFHFNDVGNFTLLSDAEGYLLEATFVGVGPIEDVPKETSWTSEVRIYNPKGDKITCHLPRIIPNTSTIEVSAQAAGSSKAMPMTPFHRTSVQFQDMSASAVLSEGPNPVVIGCHVALPKLEVTVYQVSGWEQASRFESEKWAAPYTWLNFDVKLLKPLSLPVMGILGATYPVTPQDQAALDANSETAKVLRANVATDPVAMRELEDTASAPGKARRLFSADMFPLAATFKGMQLP
ncbi:hypothetical protein N2152v2_011075 [Parachlorella kessleri]